MYGYVAGPRVSILLGVLEQAPQIATFKQNNVYTSLGLKHRKREIVRGKRFAKLFDIPGYIKIANDFSKYFYS